MTNATLIAVPLFIFMGVIMEKSKVAEDLLTSMAKLFGRMKSGLGLSVVIVGALLLQAPESWCHGIAMGLISLPAMLNAVTRKKYPLA